MGAERYRLRKPVLCNIGLSLMCIIVAQAFFVNYFNMFGVARTVAQILTCHGAVSMVPAAFEGGEAFFHSCQDVISGVGTMTGTRDDDGKKEHKPAPSPDEAALSARLSGLGDRLSKLEKTRQTAKDQTGTEEKDARSRASMMAVGIRLSSELIAGVLVGALLGWGIDYFLSTSPLGMIVFLLLGFAAGVINVMRSAGVMAKQHDRLK